MHPLKLVQIGAQLAVILPPELQALYGLKAGDAVYLSNRPGSVAPGMAASALEGQFSADPATVEQLHAGHQFMRDFHAAFRALAR